jgi:hypothetical protein
MSFLCDNEQALVGDDAQLNYKDQYLILARLLTEKEVCCFAFCFDFVINGVLSFRLR